MGEKKKEALTKFNRDNIIDAAKKLFELQGIMKTTMNDIAKEADYSKATIYAYFKSKDEIYYSIVYEYMNLLKSSLEEEMNKYNNFQECYYGICNCLVEFEEKYPFYFNRLIGEIETNQDILEGNVILKDIYLVGEEINLLISQFIQIGINEKILKEKIEVLPTVFFMWSSLSGIIKMTANKKEYFQLATGMDKKKYLDYCFQFLYQSMIR